jgi:hypothetical protein
VLCPCYRKHCSIPKEPREPLPDLCLLEKTQTKRKITGPLLSKPTTIEDQFPERLQKPGKLHETNATQYKQIQVAPAHEPKDSREQPIAPTSLEQQPNHLTQAWSKTIFTKRTLREESHLELCQASQGF